jgi:sporadic carbohydrate cluster protein (TIGR04323 family)
MSILTIQTGINMNPWKIPQRAQQILMDNYLAKNKKSSNLKTSSSIFSGHFSRLFMILKERRNLKTIVFTSIFQIPKSKSGIKIFKTLVEDYELHFALENLVVSNLAELNVIIEELNISRKIPTIKNYNINKLYKLSKFR